MSQEHSPAKSFDKIEIVKQHYANVSAGRIEKDREIVSDVMIHVSPVAGTVKGVDAFLEFVTGFKKSFPDLRFELKNIAQSQDTVLVESVFSGTNTGPLPSPTGSIRPTGKTVQLPFVDVWKIVGERITENRIYYDQTAFQSQLGLTPASAQ
ncbi:ester cyclase [Candidatus Bathyarchaeota archaeon]|nr:ester cyclase [Candidatus Bathyarchaeota archaeon]